MSYNLEKLSENQNRQAVLLAELAGLLHNLGKLDPNFFPNQVSDTSSAIRQIRTGKQFIEGYKFKRFAQLSAGFLAKARSSIASTAKLDPTTLPPVAAGDLGRAQQQAAENFNEFFRGTGVLDQAETVQLQALQFAVGGESWPLTDLLTLFWDDKFVYKASGDDYQRQYALACWLTQPNAVFPLLLALSHGEMSGSEKYRIADDPITGNPVAAGVEQSKTSFDQLRIATAFGFEPDQTLDIWNFQSAKKSLIASLPTTLAEVVTKRQGWVQAIRMTLKRGLGDSQWPVNEISLWDYASSIAALFKACMTKSILEGKVADANQMHWRWLSLRLDGLDYLFQANRVADLIARHDALEKALGVVQKSLECSTPLGNEVYRDEHGSYFVIPDLQGVSVGELKTQIEAIVRKALTAEGYEDVQPHISLGEGPLQGKRLNLGREMQRLGAPEQSTIGVATMSTWWQEQREEICTVCQIRPQGFVPRLGAQELVSPHLAKKRKVCGVCLVRRQGRARRWAEQEYAQATIWSDEVVDENGRLALITGCFDLNHWLDGVLIESLALGHDQTSGQPVSKFASFPRVQRVWSTTKQFWQDVEAELRLQADILHPHHLRDDRRRLKLTVEQDLQLEEYHVYELRLGDVSLSVLWDGRQLVSTDNLSYVARQLNPDNGRFSPVDGALAVGVWIDERKNDRTFRLIEPPEIGSLTSEFTIRIRHVDYEDSTYASQIPILAEPRTFMALVPADKALDVVRAIAAKYEREMGKVRNRLPLTLGVVYAERRTPLRAVLEAGRRMLVQRPLGPMDAWEVRQDVVRQTGPLPKVASDLADGTQQFQEWYAVSLANQALDRTLTWYVPAVMGDGQTEDCWYPYVFLKTDTEPTDRNRRFQAPNPWTGQTGWLVHVGELKEGDAVYFTPPTLDFEFLDTAGRRFEIAYDETGRRRGRSARPYLLEELTTLDAAWEAIAGPAGLTNSQIHALRDLIETKRQEWRPVPADCARDAGMFWRFCRDALLAAQWPEGCRPTGDALYRLTSCAASGLLNDVIELRMGIMKESSQRSANQEEMHQ